MSHSLLSPSKWDRWGTCPGSVKKCAALPPAPTSTFAEEGTFAHKAFETALKRGELTMDDVNGNLEMFNALTTAIDVVEQEKAKFSRIEVFELEQRVTPILSLPETAGTSDIILAGRLEDNRRISVALDLKYGKGVPVPATSGQLRLYAMGAATAIGGYFDGMRSVVIQPRLTMKNPPTPGINFSMDQMAQFYQEAYNAAMATRADNAPLVPSTKACRWCEAKDTCFAYQSRETKKNTDFLDIINGV